MITLTFLDVDPGREYTVWTSVEDMPNVIAEELAKPGIVMVGIGCTERGVID